MLSSVSSIHFEIRAVRLWMLVSQSAKALVGLTLGKSWNRIKQINTIFCKALKLNKKLLANLASVSFIVLWTTRPRRPPFIMNHKIGKVYFIEGNWVLSDRKVINNMRQSLQLALPFVLFPWIIIPLASSPNQTPSFNKPTCLVLSFSIKRQEAVSH